MDMMFWGMFLTMAAVALVPAKGGWLQQLSNGFSSMWSLTIMFVAIWMVFGGWAPAISLIIGVISFGLTALVALFGDVEIPSR